MLKLVEVLLNYSRIVAKSEPLRGKALATAGIVMSTLAVIPPAAKLPSFVKSTFETRDFEIAGVIKRVSPWVFNILLEPKTGYNFLAGMGFQTKYGIITARHILDEVEETKQVKVVNAFRKARTIDKKWILHQDLDIAIIPEINKGAKVLEIADFVGRVGEPVLYLGLLGNNEEYSPLRGKIKTVYKKPNSEIFYLTIETAGPVVIGSPVVNKKGMVLGLFVATSTSEGLAISISGSFLKDKFVVLGSF